MRHRQQGGLRYAADKRSLAFVAVTLLLLLSPVWIPVPSWLQVLWIVMASLFCFSVCIINHNHIHHPVFRSSWLNSLFGVFLTLAKGHTSSGVIAAHNTNHHVHKGNDKDWICTDLAGNGYGILRLMRFIVAASVSMARGRNSIEATLLPASIRRQLRLERMALILFIFLLAYVGGISALLFVGIPWLAGMAMLVGVNLLQHDGCDPQSSYRHSRNFTGVFGNWFFFNNGYHTIHHLQPALHWTLLPEMHRSNVKPHIDPVLDVPSILGFLFGDFLFRCTGDAIQPGKPERM